MLDQAERLTNVLQTTGGWGVSAVCLFVIWKLWKWATDKDERIFSLLDKQNEVLEAIKERDKQN